MVNLKNIYIQFSAPMSLPNAERLWVLFIILFWFRYFIFSFLQFSHLIPVIRPSETLS